MVVDCLLRTVATRLQTALSVNDSWVRVMPDAKPIPSMGSWFISVYGGKFRKVHEESYCIRGPLHFHLMMTMRASAIPFDKQGTDLSAKATTGMIAIFETAIASIEGRNSDIVNTANNTIGYVGVESAPILISADYEATERRGGGIPGGWLQAVNEERAAFTMEADFLIYINRTRP